MKSKPLILLVNSNQRNLELLTSFLSNEGYCISTARSLEELDRHLSALPSIGLTLLDISGFASSIWERCEYLRNKKIPFIVISPKQSTTIQQASLTYGARGVMVKPLGVKNLLSILAGMLATEMQEEYP